jgi:hypothetical protein
MHEYAFDIRLNTTARTYADTETQAREHLLALDGEFQLEYRTSTAGGEVWLTDASMAHEAADAVLIEPEPAVPPAEFPLYRAGCDGYEPVFGMTLAAGWTRYTDESGDNHTDVSPDGQLAVEFGPEADAPATAPLWRIYYRDPDPYRRSGGTWAAYFEGGTPPEAIAAFLAAVTDRSTRPAVRGAASGEAKTHG